ncbi:DUF948 domain-containing protein [Paenibacillus thalictri]|uniref:DUF948 domain-containing protein n=1 Tax=Paenibacillus thalictri TaxID=2527873 RepID=A0A4Q9DXS1_9BACL|nr:DUF948 domain-containing protein [Paenibacillus thalictri]TBL81185.1 DUF948 domain-containing protein [Paenibacillus thalictri]
MVVDICAAAAAIAFIVLVVYAVRALHTVRLTLQNADRTLQRTAERACETADQSVQLMRQTSEIAEDMKRKLAVLDRFMGSIDELSQGFSQAGISVQMMSQAVSRSVQGVEQAVHNHRDAIAEIVELTGAGFQLWQRWQSYRDSKQSEESEHHKGDE